MNLLEKTSFSVKIKRIWPIFVGLLVVGCVLFYNNYQLSLQRQLDLLKSNQQNLLSAIRKETLSRSTNSDWSRVLEIIPENNEEIFLQSLKKNKDFLTITGEGKDLRAIAEFAILIESNTIINNVNIQKIERINEPQEKIIFEINISPFDYRKEEG